jgi:hypothetical protein
MKLIQTSLGEIYVTRIIVQHYFIKEILYITFLSHNYSTTMTGQLSLTIEFSFFLTMIDLRLCWNCHTTIVK